MKKGWTTKRLGDVVTRLTNGYVGPTRDIYLESGVPYLLARHVKDNKLDFDGRTFVSPAFNEKHKKSRLKAGDVLLVQSGHIGHSAVVSEAHEGHNCHAMIVISPVAGVLSGPFLSLHFNSPQTRRKFDEIRSGSTVPHLTCGAVKEMQIPVPPLAEQQRIVGVLDEAFAGIATAQANAERNLQNARALFESHLQSVFTQHGKGWAETTLGDVCEFVGGSQPPKSVFSKTKTADNIRLIQIRDYKSDKHVVYIPRSQARRFCNADDVMIGRYGPPLFQILRGLDGAYNVALMKAVPDEAKLSRDFLFYFLKHSAILQYVVYHSERAAGQIGVTKETLQPYPIALPSLLEQEKVVETITELESETRRLEKIYERKLAALAALKKSLLHQAFTGAL